nr:DUF4215 domain-containing protein [Nannocystis pusilla]
MRWVGVEQCDGGADNGEDKPCKPDCTGAICGDGFVGPGEACDDANLVNEDGCTNACKLPTCGDGFVQAGEQCDAGAGNDNTGSCTLACKVSACGDGFVQAGEGCDDGNLVQTDDCPNHCQLPVCGDGYAWAGHELCDDGNATQGDGCFECLPAKRAFVTSTTYDGNLGGLAGAAAKCQTRADAAGLGGTWDVWLSTDASSPSTRFLPSLPGYRRIDNVIVANTLADLTDGTIDIAISVTELGTTPSASDVWTGSGPNGQATTATCTNWTTNSSAVTGEYGRSNGSNAVWSDNGNPATCNGLRRLYCFEL